MFKKQVFLMLVLSLVLMSCSGIPTQPDPFKQDLFTVFETGNWTYITFNSHESGYGVPSQKMAEIASAIKNWEDTHPNRRIVTLQIVYSLESYTYSPTIDGISIYSQPVNPQ